MNLNQVSPLLSPQQIGELASNLDAIHTRTVKAIQRLQADIDARKAEIANRWKSAGIDAADKARFAQSETVAAVRQIKDNSVKELDKLLKDAGAPHAQLVSQRDFYSSPAKVLSRAALGVVLAIAAYCTHDYVSVGCVAALGFANAMMWPAIFPLAIARLGRHTETGSALLIMGIAGGAIIPQIFARLREHHDFQLVFAAIMVPCYLYILYFGTRGHNVGRR